MNVHDPGGLPVPCNAQIDGRHVSWMDAGPEDAPPVVLLHGGGLDRASLSWRLLMPELARTHRVIAPDWPGHGDSAGLNRPFVIADLGAWLLDVLDHLAVPKADFVGISMGAGVALWLGLHHPDRVHRIVAAGAYGLHDRAPAHPLSWLATRLPLAPLGMHLVGGNRWLVQQAVSTLFARPDRVSDDLIDEMLETLKAPRAGDAFADFQRGEIGPGSLHTVLTPQLPLLAATVLFLHGREDGLVPLSAVETAARACPQGRLQVLDTGHWPMRESPAEFNRLTADFLADPTPA
ncbi:alpha/beta fold hydrolase [Fluviibacterium sp. DFM31]|uniref:Alpha/beta fold hydrolase n=1 Tax=Meridianimarinicoccus marinus TaxID=3231483 RepID=A0ABV3L3W4_9RHOB